MKISTKIIVNPIFVVFRVTLFLSSNVVRQVINSNRLVVPFVLEFIDVSTTNTQNCIGSPKSPQYPL